MKRLRARSGPRTAELARVAGGFGLGQVPARLRPEATTAMVCGFCSVGCSLDAHLRDGEAVNLTPTTEYPVNRGMACPKGWQALAPLRADDRATTPLWRDDHGRLRPVSWEVAIGTFVDRFGTLLDEHGPESVAFLSTGQIATEEMAFLGALTKFGMGMLHGDGNTRQCMATSVAAYKESFGFDAPPYTYADLEESDVIVLVGSNLCITHPVLWERVRSNPHAPEIVVIDPRATETATAATQHLPLLPKSDLELLYGLAHLLMRWDAVDHEFVAAHTDGFSEFAEHVAGFTPARVASATGLTEEAIERCAATIRDGARVSFWWTMGVNQGHQATRTAQAIIDLALMTGNIGRPGTGANSITGQCNAMGSRLFSNTASLLGGRDFAVPEHRRDVADILGMDAARIPERASLAYDQILDGVAAGRIKGLWIVATNTAHSWISKSELREALGRLDFLVVQDLYTTTDTAQLADLVLPAAGWGEKEGTFINSERRVGVIKRVARAPGDALADFSIFRLIADAWGCVDLFSEWTSPEAVWAILQRLSAGRPCDLTGAGDYRAIDAAGGIQWPAPAGTDVAARHERRLFEDGRFFHPDGRARFVVEAPRPVPEPLTERFPLIMLTGRGTSTQWHTETRTAKAPILASMAPQDPYVEISPVDAATRGLTNGEWVEVASTYGAMRARARITTTVATGQVFVPMHPFGTNRVTAPVFDPCSRQPAYKWAAVDVTREAGIR